MCLLLKSVVLKIQALSVYQAWSVGTEFAPLEHLTSWQGEVATTKVGDTAVHLLGRSIENYEVFAIKGGMLNLF